MTWNKNLAGYQIKTQKKEKETEKKKVQNDKKRWKGRGWCETGHWSGLGVDAGGAGTGNWDEVEDLGQDTKKNKQISPGRTGTGMVENIPLQMYFLGLEVPPVQNEHHNFDNLIFLQEFLYHHQ